MSMLCGSETRKKKAQRGQTSPGAIQPTNFGLVEEVFHLLDKGR